MGFFSAILSVAASVIGGMILGPMGVGLFSAGSIGAEIVTGVGRMLGSGLAALVLGSNSSAQQQKSSQDRANGITINTASNVEPIPVVYGVRKVGRSRFVVGVSGANNQYIHIIVVIGEGPIEEVTEVYFDDILSTDSRFSPGGTPAFRINTHLGDDAQTADSDLVAEMPSVWTSAHRGRGVAYIYVRLTWDQNVWRGLPNITAKIKGRTVYNPATTLTAYSNNPAHCLRDYLTNTRYGRALPTAYFDDTACIALATHCDDMVAIPGPSTQKRYTCDGVVDTGQKLFDNVNEMLTSCRGMLVKSGTKYKLLADKIETPSTFALSEDNITGSWTIRRLGRTELFNRVQGHFFSSAIEYNPDLAIADSTAYRTMDNELMLEGEVTLPFTSDKYRAMQLAQLYLKHSRFGLVAQFTAFQEGLRCEVGDVVPITHSAPGWTAKPMRIIKIEIQGDHEVAITAKEYDATAYDLDTLTTITGAATVNLPNPYSVAAPTGLVLTTLDQDVVTRDTTIKRLKVSWDIPADTFIGVTEVWADINDMGTFTQVASTAATDGVVWISPVEEGDKWEVKIRHRNSLGIYSAFSSTVTTYILPPSGLFWNQNNGVLFWDIDDGVNFWSVHDIQGF